MTEPLFVFVYAKEKNIKVLSFTDAKLCHYDLLKDGWIRTKTLDACKYLEFLHNELVSRSREIDKLSNH